MRARAAGREWQLKLGIAALLAFVLVDSLARLFVIFSISQTHCFVFRFIHKTSTKQSITHFMNATDRRQHGVLLEILGAGSAKITRLPFGGEGPSTWDADTG